MSKENKTSDVMDKIRLDKEVKSINYTNPENVTVTTTDGTRYYTRHVIFTPSLGVLKQHHASMFIPALPESKQKAIEVSIIVAKLKSWAQIFLVISGTRFWSYIENLSRISQSMVAWWPGHICHSLVKKREGRFPSWEWTGKNGSLTSLKALYKLCKLSQQDKEWLLDIFEVFTVINQPRVLEVLSYGKSAKFSETLSDEQIMEQLHLLFTKIFGKVHKDIPKPEKILRYTVLEEICFFWHSIERNFIFQELNGRVIHTCLGRIRTTVWKLRNWTLRVKIWANQCCRVMECLWVLDFS